MEQPQPTINEVFSEFSGKHIEDSTGVHRRRIERVDYLLRLYLEAEADAYLTDPEKIVLAAEQQFRNKGAVCRTMQAEALLFALPQFIAPPYLQADPLLRRVQLQLAEGLFEYLVRTVLAGYDTSCVQHELRFALDKAKWQLNRERRERATARRMQRELERSRALHEQQPQLLSSREEPP